MSATQEQTAITPTDEPGVTPSVSATGPAPAAEKPERDGTTYLILVKVEGGWKIGSAELQARSAEAAVRQYAESLGDAIPAAGATLVAVPTRNWREVSVKAQTVTTLVIEGA